jgi:hypothetical protein
MDVGIKRTARGVVQVEGTGFPAFGANNGNRASPLVEDTLIKAEGRHLADPEPGPIAQRKNRRHTQRLLALDEVLEHGALFGSEFGGRERWHGRAFNLVGRIALELTGIDGPAAEAGNRGERLGTGTRCPLFCFQVSKVPFQGGDRQERGMKGCAVGLGG